MKRKKSGKRWKAARRSQACTPFSPPGRRRNSNSSPRHSDSRSGRSGKDCGKKHDNFSLTTGAPHIIVCRRAPVLFYPIFNLSSNSAMIQSASPPCTQLSKTEERTSMAFRFISSSAIATALRALSFVITGKLGLTTTKLLISIYSSDLLIFYIISF